MCTTLGCVSEDVCPKETTVCDGSCSNSGKAKKHPSVLSAKVKIINPQNSGSCVIEEWTVDNFHLSDLKSGMGQAFAEYVHCYEFDIGYIILGHVMKDKLNQLNNDGNIATIYAEFARRKSLLFWVKCLLKKRPSSESTSGCPPPKH